MNDHEENSQDISIARQQQRRYMPSTDPIRLPRSSLLNLLIRLGLKKASFPDPIEALYSSADWQGKALAIQAMAQLGNNAPIGLIQRYLKKHYDEAIRIAAVRTLEELWKFGNVQLELFLYALGDSHAHVRLAAIQALESLEPDALPESVITYLTEQLRHEEKIVRIAILSLLGTLGKNAPIDELVAALEDEDWQIRESAVFALGKLNESVPVPETPLLDAFYDSSRFVRDAAILVLGERLPIDLFFRHLRYGEAAIREKAVQLLADLGERRPEKQIVHALFQAARRDKLPSVRKAALLALGQMGLPVSRSSLQPSLHDSDQEVREVASILLDMLDSDFPSDVNLDDDETGEQEALGAVRDTEHSMRSIPLRESPAKPLQHRENLAEMDFRGRQFSYYRLLCVLARRGQATVYQAEHVQFHTKVAIKVLHTHLADLDARHFLKEARTIARLKHPNIVRVLDSNVEHDTPYIVMDYVPGGALRRLLVSESFLPVTTVVAYVKQIASALDYAHSRGITHLDIKPENLLVGENQLILLTDFGIAQTQQFPYRAHQEPIAGTRSYAAPEQLVGNPDPASDQYALGIVAYECLIGESPYKSAYYAEQAGQVGNWRSAAFLHKKLPRISKEVYRVLLRALEQKPEDRYPDIMAFADALEQAAFPTNFFFKFWRRE